jgi:hypothetical protein
MGKSNARKKRGLDNTSINTSIGSEDENKNNKMNEEVEKNDDEVSIMIIDGGSVYDSNPAQLKRDFERMKVDTVIKESKITVSNYLIITFINEEGLQLFKSKKAHFKEDIQIIELNKTKKFEIVLKGLSFAAIDGYKFNLSKMGITKLFQLNKSNEQFRMVKAECVDENVMKKVLKEGIKLDYYSIKVEEFRRQIRPLQCFNCQQYGHVALKCLQKENPVCLKCSGEHRVDECDSQEIRCANCGEEHKSSSSECNVFKLKLEEKMKIINKNKDNQMTTKRVFSQAVNNIDQQQVLIDTITLNMRAGFENMQKKIDDSFAKQKDELSCIRKEIKEVEADFQLYKAKEFFVNVEMFKIMNNDVAPTSEQIRGFHDAFKFHHNFEINISSVKNYFKNEGFKKKSNRDIKYLNE